MTDPLPPPGRLFVANRGEIALRIIRAAHALGIETVLGVSAADRDSLAAQEAGRTVVLGPPPSRNSYLNGELVVHAALKTGCDALHPGYGFLSERPELADLCDQERIVFIGPTAAAIRSVGDKLSAKRLAERAGVPMTRGSGKITDVQHALQVAESVGYPVITKASAGGGGRGMIVARNSEELTDAFNRAAATAREAFGDDTLYIERYVERARHLEVQVMGDGNGQIVHFGERDCSIQRRYQKMIEEAPASILPKRISEQLRAAAVNLLGSINYRNAGTVEFLYDVGRQEFSFMEVNARIQVEHPVSEQITRTDLIRMQIEVATQRRPLPEQRTIAVQGHAIEARILAEDPANNFSPSPGRITHWRAPTGAGVRVDSGFGAGSMVPPFYDSMIAKLIVHGRSRDEAVERLAQALLRFEVQGISTNLPLLIAIATHDDFRRNDISTRWLESTLLPDFAARATSVS
jgi:acetyl-CoA carboxylase, biotin carboxylase subunit